MSCGGKIFKNSAGMLGWQEMRLGWKRTGLNGSFVPLGSSHCPFLKAGKLAVDRGWAINVGKYIVH